MFIIFTYMNTIQSVTQIGELIRSERKRQKILQQDLADLSGVSLHFLSNLENGKPAVEFQKVLLVLRSLGIEMELKTRFLPNEAP
jgi:HTH-type transcriptional regulator / antitoxin HipB